MQVAMRDEVQSLGPEDHLEEGMVTTPVSCLENSMDKADWWLQSMGPAQSGTHLALQPMYYAFKITCQVWVTREGAASFAKKIVCVLYDLKKFKIGPHVFY